MTVTPSGLVIAIDGVNVPVTDWPTIRKYVLERDGYRCQICKIRGASDVDHIWPRRLGGVDHVENLRAACGPCNKGKGARVVLEEASTTQIQQGIEALSMRVSEMLAEMRDLGRAICERHLADGTKAEVDQAFKMIGGEAEALADYVADWKKITNKMFAHGETWNDLEKQRSDALMRRGEYTLRVAEIDRLLALHDLAPDSLTPLDAAIKLNADS